MNMEQHNLILNAILTFVTFTLKNKQNKKKTAPQKTPGTVLIQIGLTVDTVSHHGKQLKAGILIGYWKSHAQTKRSFGLQFHLT